MTLNNFENLNIVNLKRKELEYYSRCITEIINIDPPINEKIKLLSYRILLDNRLINLDNELVNRINLVNTVLF